MANASLDFMGQDFIWAIGGGGSPVTNYGRPCLVLGEIQGTDGPAVL